MDRRTVAFRSLVGLLTVAAVAALVVRYLGHALFLHDLENLMIPTVAWEVRHGHWDVFPQYQFNLYQGSIYPDVAASWLGFAVFGEHLAAWKWWPLAYAGVIAGAGAAVVRHTSGRLASVLWLLLFAGLPFLVKDGLIMPAGGHTSALAFPLLALAVALARPHPSAARSLLAGAILGVGTYYNRGCVVAGPALVVACAPGGLRAVVSLLVGCSVLIPMTLANAAVLVSMVPGYQDQALLDVWRKLTLELRAQAMEIDRLGKLLEVVGWRLQGLFFAQPPDPLTGHVPWHPAYGLATKAWAWTLAAAVPLAAVATALRRRTDDARSPGVVLLIVGLLAAGYLGSYVASPYGIEGQIVEAASRLRPGAEMPAGPRYVLPGQLVLTLVFAHALGLARGRWRWGALLVGGAVAALGLASAGLDARHDGEPPELRATLPVVRYANMFGPQLGPPMALHRDCRTEEPLARANHLRTWARFEGSARLPRPTVAGYVGPLLSSLMAEGEVAEADALFLADGLGRSLGGQPEEPARLLATAFDRADELGGARGLSFLLGAAGGMAAVDRLASGPDFLLLCRAYGGGRPLCPGVAGAHWTPLGALTEDPLASLGPSAPPELSAEPLRTSTLEGLGAADGRYRVLTAADRAAMALWSVGDRSAWERGFDRARRRWRWDRSDPWDPEHVP